MDWMDDDSAQLNRAARSDGNPRLTPVFSLKRTNPLIGAEAGEFYARITCQSSPPLRGAVRRPNEQMASASLREGHREM